MTMIVEIDSSTKRAFKISFSTEVQFLIILNSCSNQKRKSTTFSRSCQMVFMPRFAQKKHLKSPADLFRDSTPCRLKGASLCTILRSPILADGPKCFYRPQYILNLRWKRAPKKRDFLVKIFQKVHKTPFWPVSF